jgi:hypothetical protein
MTSLVKKVSVTAHSLSSACQQQVKRVTKIPFQYIEEKVGVSI